MPTAILQLLGGPLRPQPGLELVERGLRCHFADDVDILGRAWRGRVSVDGSRTHAAGSSRRLELIGERGFEQTTVAQIATWAGLTERTLFRHFADKREVLAGGAGELRELLVSALADAPDSVAPIDAVGAALAAAGALLQERREFSRQRHIIIAANAELQERELINLASLASALADVLRRRGVRDPAASLTAEAGIAVFRIAFERWIEQTNQQDFRQLVRDSLDELKAVTAGK